MGSEQLRWLALAVLVLAWSSLHAQWQRTVPPMPSTNDFATIGTTIYAGTGTGVYVSTDGGRHWDTTALGSSYVNALIASGGTLFAAVQRTIYRSSDGGASWTAVTTGLPSNVYVGRLATDNQLVYAGTTAHGLFRSTDNGQHWVQANIPITIQSVPGILIDGGRVLTATAEGVYTSTDQGDTWSRTNDGLPDFGVGPLVLRDSIIYASSHYHGEVYTSIDHGTSWTLVSPVVGVHALACSGAKLFAGTSGHGVFLSENGGSVFYPLNDGLESLFITRLAIINDLVFAGTSSDGIWVRFLSECVTAVREKGGKGPGHALLDQNYPNPFNPSTTIRYGLPFPSRVMLTVFNTLGQQIAVLQNGEQGAGYHDAVFDAHGLPSGVYFYRLQVRPSDSVLGPDSRGGAGAYTATKCSLLLK